MSFHAKLLSAIFASWLSKSLNNKGTLTCPRVLSKCYLKMMSLGLLNEPPSLKC